MKTCPRCAEDVKAAALACRWCGHEFGAAEAAGAARAEATGGLILVGAIVAALAGAAIWSGSSSPPPPAAPAGTGNWLHDRVAAMAEPDRRAAFARFMRANGERCPSVRRTFYQGMERASRTAFWNVDCGGRRQWIVSIEPDGKGKLLECGVSKMFGAGGCWRTFDAMNAAAKAKRPS